MGVFGRQSESACFWERCAAGGQCKEIEKTGKTSCLRLTAAVKEYMKKIRAWLLEKSWRGRDPKRSLWGEGTDSDPAVSKMRTVFRQQS
jgi:hypothetical protein